MFQKTIHAILCSPAWEILLVKNTSDPSVPSRWGLPGGTIDSWEMLTEALHRQIRTQTGIDTSQYRTSLLTSLDISSELTRFYSIVVCTDHPSFTIWDPEMIQETIWIDPYLPLDTMVHDEEKIIELFRVKMRVV